MPRKQTNFAASAAAVSHGIKRAKLQKQCDEWNSNHPIGTHVILSRENGEIIHTRTRSTAQIVGGHSAVIWTEATPGCCLLDRVIPDHSEIL